MSYSSRASSLQTPPLRVARSSDTRPSLDTSARSIGITSVNFGLNESHASQDRSRPSRAAVRESDPLSDEQLSTLSELKALQPEMIEVQSAIKSMRSLNDSLRREAAESAAEIHVCPQLPAISSLCASIGRTHYFQFCPLFAQWP